MFCNGGFPKGCVSELMALGRGRVLMRAAMKGPDDMLPIVKNIWGEVELGGYEGGVVERPRLNADVLDLRTGVIPENSILPHQELAYSDKVPTFLAFGCFQAAERGGITTLTDMKQVQQLLPHGLLGKLWDLGLSYFYNYHNNAFHQHAEAPVPYFDPAQWDNQWETHPSFHSRTPDRVRLCTTRPAFALHPCSKQVGLLMSVISFHGFNYGSDQWKKFKPLDRPMHCTWGDGSEINDEEFGLMREAYTQATEHVVLGPGDLLVLDNYRFAHGRTAYEGTRIMGGLLSENLPRTNLCPVPEPTVVRPTWTRLATVPKEDYMKSKSEYLRSAEPPYIANRMLNLLESLGASNSIPGYPVTTKEHCVQTASAWGNTCVHMPMVPLLQVSSCHLYRRSICGWWRTILCLRATITVPTWATTLMARTNFEATLHSSRLAGLQNGIHSLLMPSIQVIPCPSSPPCSTISFTDPLFGGTWTVSERVESLSANKCNVNT